MTTGDDRAEGAISARPVVADAPGSRSWQRAFGDLRQGWKQRPLWGYLGWQDIKQRYRRSVLGPLWVSISMAVIATAMGILYGALFQMDLPTFLPYVATGLLIWNFVNGCILEGSEVFIANEGLIKFLPAPLSLHVYRLIWRQTLLFAHNMLVYLIMLVVFPQPLSWTVLAVFPALALLALNGAWVALLFGIVTTRFRDLTPIIQSVVQLLFFLTPIVWIYEDLINSPNTAIAARARLVEFNPLLHYIEIIRQPMLGHEQHIRHWIVVLVLTVVGWAFTLFALRRYRARVPYWV
jgi:ABC-2 type transport system permease protein